MATYEEATDTLERELGNILAVFAGLTDDEWRMPTKLVPLDPS